VDVEPGRERGISPDEGAPRDPGPPSTPRRRRARTEPPPGSDPHPAPEPDRHDTRENDARLRADKPPHY